MIIHILLALYDPVSISNICKNKYDDIVELLQRNTVDILSISEIN